MTSKAKMNVVKICELWTIRDKFLIQISLISVTEDETWPRKMGFVGEP